MGESLTEQRRVSDEGPLDCKALLRGTNDRFRKWERFDGTSPESDG